MGATPILSTETPRCHVLTSGLTWLGAFPQRNRPLARSVTQCLPGTNYRPVLLYSWFPLRFFMQILPLFSFSGGSVYRSEVICLIHLLVRGSAAWYMRPLPLYTLASPVGSAFTQSPPLWSFLFYYIVNVFYISYILFYNICQARFSCRCNDLF